MKSFCACLLLFLASFPQVAIACEESLALADSQNFVANFQNNALSKEASIPTFEPKVLKDILALLYSEGCRQVLLQATFVRLRQHWFRKHVLIKIIGVNGDKKLCVSFAFRATSSSLLHEIYSARGPHEQHHFSDVSTIMSNNPGRTATIDLRASPKSTPVSAEESAALRDRLKDLLP